jgi:hypothetical protein
MEEILRIVCERRLKAGVVRGIDDLGYKTAVGGDEKAPILWNIDAALENVDPGGKILLGSDYTHRT